VLAQRDLFSTAAAQPEQPQTGDNSNMALWGTMLEVDKDIEVSKREQTEWLKHGISTVRVDTMQEAIEKLTKEPFLFTATNAGNVNYLPLLKTMRDTAPTFIFIIDTNYTTEKEVEALHNGADVYTKLTATWS